MLCDLYVDSLQYQENLLAKYYTKAGHEVVIIASTFESVFDYNTDNYQSQLPFKSYTLNSVKIYKLPYSINIYNKLRKFCGVYDIILREYPDVIFSHDIHLNLTDAVKYKKFKNKNCNIIMDYHADYSNSAKNWFSLNILHKIIRKTFLSFHWKHIDKVCYVVPSSAKFLNEVYNVSYKDMELLPLGSDSDLVTEVINSQNRYKIRSKYSIPEGDVVIFTGGKLTPSKRTEILINAFINISFKNLHLFVVGKSSDEEKNYYNGLLSLANLNNRIYFIGWLDSRDVYSYLTACDFAVFPSSQSVLWQQSLSVGIPIVVGQYRDQEINYLNKYGAIISIPEDEVLASNFQSIIESLTYNPDLLCQMKNAARLTSEEFLNYNRIVQRTLA